MNTRSQSPSHNTHSTPSASQQHDYRERLLAYAKHSWHTKYKHIASFSTTKHSFQGRKFYWLVNLVLAITHDISFGIAYFQLKLQKKILYPLLKFLYPHLCVIHAYFWWGVQPLAKLDLAIHTTIQTSDARITSFLAHRIIVFTQVIHDQHTRLISKWRTLRTPTISISKKKQGTIYPSKPRQVARSFKALGYPFWATATKYPWQTIFSLILSALMLGGTYSIHEYIFKDLPAPQQLTEQEPQVSTKILDRHGNLLFVIYGEQNRTPIPLTSIAQHTIEATIAIEDQHFYQHHGFSIKGITRAIVANIQGKPLQGGSTLTQQLIKNRLLSSEQTISRKIKEVLLAILAEGIYSKEEILEMYFNQIAYGGSVYGIEAASQTYFGKPASQLNLAESALLAGLPQAPSVYSPFGPNPDLAYHRQHEVLRRMLEDGYITTEQAQEATQQKLEFKDSRIDIRAPHFVMYVRQLLAEKYGEDVLTRGGLVVRTTLDIAQHDAMQNAITSEIANISQRLGISNGAGLITNPKTGEILAMVGSVDYFDFAHDGQVNVTLRPRQPGSSIKPLTYAIALERGKTPSSPIDDSPITFSIPGSKPYTPQNYDGSFRGRVSLRQALASSYNIPAVKLLNEIGVNTLIDKAEEMGITTWGERNRFGLSLTLGGGEVKMTDMATAYSSFANVGRVTQLNPFLEIKNYKGEQLYYNTCVLEGRNCPQRQVLTPRTAFLISDMLSDNKARTPAFGPLSTLYIPNQKVAVKTGTTNNLRDNWTIGFTSDRLVAVWVGNNDNTPMSYVASGVSGASPIWNTVMRTQLDPEHPHVFAVPPGVEKVAICTITGTRTCSGCPSVSEEYFMVGTAPTSSCNPGMFRQQPPLATGDQGEIYSVRN